MHQDKKREELEQKKEFERLQQEELFEQVELEKAEEKENIMELETEEKNEFEEFENEIERAKKKKREVIFEFALFLVLGILIGVTIKTEAIKKITIGFNDYQIESGKERYDIASIKAGLEQKAIEQQKEIEEQTAQQELEVQQ